MKGLFFALLFFLTAAAEVMAQDSAAAEFQVMPGEEQIDSLTDDEWSDEKADSLQRSAYAENLKSYHRQNPIHHRFDTAKWKKIIGNNHFNEKKEEPAPQQQRKPIKVAPWVGPVLQWTAYIIVAGLISFLFYYLITNISWSGSIAQNAVTLSDAEAPVQNIDDLDIQSLLRQAIESANFRMAIRLYYLGVLRVLNTSGKINWKKDKTNRDYLSELFAKSYYFDEVRKLTIIYEQVWYGDQALTADSFQRLQNNFENLNKQISAA